MKKLISFTLSIFVSTVCFSQVKSIAIINDIDDQLFILKETNGLTMYARSTYNCDFKSSVIAEAYLKEILGDDYKVEMIMMPDEHRKSPGMVRGSASHWFRSLNDQYDVVIYLYTHDKYNGQLYPDWDQLYSSGILTWKSGDERTKGQVFTSVSGRAFSTKSGRLFCYLNHNELDSSEIGSNKVVFDDINSPAVCDDASRILQALIRYRINKFVDDLEYAMKDL